MSFRIASELAFSAKEVEFAAAIVDCRHNGEGIIACLKPSIQIAPMHLVKCAQSIQTLCCRSAPEEIGTGIMVKTYRDVAIEQMIATVEDAMSRVIDWWGELPMPMNEAMRFFVSNSGRQSIPSNL